MKKTLTTILIAASLLGGCKKQYNENPYKEYLIEKSVNPRILDWYYSTDIIKEPDRELFIVSYSIHPWEENDQFPMIVAVDKYVDNKPDGKYDEIKIYDEENTPIKALANQVKLDSLKNVYMKRLQESDLSDF